MQLSETMSRAYVSLLEDIQWIIGYMSQNCIKRNNFFLGINKNWNFQKNKNWIFSFLFFWSMSYSISGNISFNQSVFQYMTKWFSFMVILTSNLLLTRLTQSRTTGGPRKELSSSWKKKTFDYHFFTNMQSHKKIKTKTITQKSIR